MGIHLAGEGIEMEDLEVLEEEGDLEELEELEELEDQRKMSLSFPLGRRLPLTVLRAWPRQPRKR